MVAKGTGEVIVGGVVTAGAVLGAPETGGGSLSGDSDRPGSIGG